MAPFDFFKCNLRDKMECVVGSDREVMSYQLPGEMCSLTSLLNKCLNIVIVKGSKIGQCMWLNINVNSKGFVPT